MLYPLVIGLLLLAGPVMAQNSCASKSIFEFYQSFKDQNPVLNQISKRMEQAEAGIDIAKQRPNPELELDYLKGRQFGVDLHNVSTKIQHIYEFGSKRSRRIQEASLSADIQKKELGLDGLGTTVNYVLKYQRIAQLNHLIDAVKEAVHTFDGAVKRFQSRVGLNPEDRVSMSTLKLAASDYRARLNDLENERTLLEGELAFISGCESLKPAYVTLGYKQVLPLLKEVANSDSGLVSIQDLKVKHAEAQLEVERSLGYSNIGIGPAFEYQAEGRDKFISAGIALNFAIPFFHTNTGGKLAATKQLVAQKIESANTINNLNIKKSRLLQKYQRSIGVLSRMPSLETMDRQHHESEALFSRGIVSIPMTIESHRQRIDFLESRFETENDLLISLEELIFITGHGELIGTLFQASPMDVNTKDQQ